MLASNDELRLVWQKMVLDVARMGLGGSIGLIMQVCLCLCVRLGLYILISL